MNKLSLVLAAGLAAVSILLLRTRQSERFFQKQRSELQQQLAEAKTEVDRLSKQAGAASAIPQKLPAEQFSELLRLRSEVTLLRQQTNAMPRMAGTIPPSLSEASQPALDRYLVEYIGEPVPPPANLDARYGKEGLINALQTAARNAGTSFQDVRVDDREFPFVVSFRAADAAKVINELKKMEGYEYGGSVSSGEVHAFNITPRNAWPEGSAKQIDRRLTLRMRALYEQTRGAD